MKIDININKFINTFINTISVENRSFQKLTKEDRKFCALLVKNYDEAVYVISDKYINSFQLVTKLNEIIYNRLVIQNSLFFDEDNNLSIENYYELLLEEYLKQKNVSNEQRDETIKEFYELTWIKEILSYIQNQCFILKHTKDLAFNDATKNMKSFTSFINESNNRYNSMMNDYDHLIEDFTFLSDDIKKTQDNVEDELNKSRVLGEKIQATSNEVIPHMLTSLGIFVSIIIAVIAVYLSDLISIHGISTSYISQFQFARFAISGHIIINLIFLMLYIISRLINKNILLRCDFYLNKKNKVFTNYRPCFNCEKRYECNFIVKIWKKATYMVGVNLIFVFSYIILYDWWIIENYIWEDFFLCIANGFEENFTSKLKFGIIFFLIFNVILIIIFAIIMKLWKNKLIKIKNYKNGKG